ncbi:hypothetical protein CGMCC3_g5285 [Colletotrichum fructicola]|uniref:2EXR domain-containing protein n=1 Tax=Colletotrichum fructicola (strain Nara gc5) TaxID=1213859 RepID=L2GF44_COLFN|nr:uncharacterized protein CGMCC3_g5285 [Colletotrichum fructicola]KAE9578742.1 hypothetical protein CGMCC3_g5285 [Colletotrichum fructicola]KAF5514388.1 hypothetical protein CGCF413_v000452 [Colletotrichum fructicola]
MDGLHLSAAATAQGVSEQFRIIEKMAQMGAEQSARCRAPSQTKRLMEIQKELIAMIEVQTRIIERLPMISRPTFHRFSRLSNELRHMIWELALPGTRIFCPQRDAGDNICLLEKHKRPAILRTCSESRKVAEKHDDFQFGRNGSRTYGCWFNNNRDIAFIQDFMWHPRNAQLPLNNCKIIAVECTNFTTKNDCIATMKWILGHVPKCQKVIICSRPDSDNLRSPQMFALRDNEQVRIFGTLYEGAATWGDSKRILENFFSQQATLDALQITEKELPGLEGKEVLETLKP